MSYPMNKEDAARFQRGKQVEQIKLEREILETLKEISQNIKTLGDNIAGLIKSLPPRAD